MSISRLAMSISQSKKTMIGSISHPVLVGTTLDEALFRRMADAGVPGVRPDLDAEWHPQTVPSLGPAREPTPESYALAASEAAFRPPSSVYSQPTPREPPQRSPRKAFNGDDYEISPPTSPDMDAGRYGGRYRSRADEAVSPIDEDETEDEPTFPTAYQKTKLPPRSTPVLRREKRRSEAAATAAGVQSRRAVSESTPATTDAKNVLRKTSAAPKYDPYTGEPTMDSKGRPQQVKPSAYSGGPNPVLAKSDERLGVRTQISGGAPRVQTSFADRLRKLRERAVVEEEEEPSKSNKPAWRGGSGRQPVVEPPTQPSKTRAFSAPIKKGPLTRGTAPAGDKRGAMYIDYDESSDTIILPPTETHPALRGGGNSIGNSADQDSSLVSLPASVGPLQLLPKQYLTEEEYNQLHAREKEKKMDRAHQSASDLHHISVGGIERNFREALQESKFASNTNNYLDPPPSRSTYEPNVYATNPRPSTSDQYPIPKPHAPPLPDDATPSILNRRRPRVNSIETMKSLSVPARKPVASAPKSPTPTATSTATTASTQKDLPLTPAEIAAKSQDQCVILQAQLDALTRRRQNIEKSIYQMTELMPVDGALGGIGGALVGGGGVRHHVVGSTDGWTGERNRVRGVMATKFTEKRREEEKLKVEELKMQLADVRKAEHEVGLRLHRAWKRRDDFAVYEPTTLWVRRITG